MEMSYEIDRQRIRARKYEFTTNSGQRERSEIRDGAVKCDVIDNDLILTDDQVLFSAIPEWKCPIIRLVTNRFLALPLDGIVLGN
jgi:hypothetical protein